MKKIFLILLLFPVFLFSQMENTIKLKVAIIQQIIKKGNDAETNYWQTKGKITFNIVNYTEAQNPIFKELFINQFREIVPIYNKMIVSEDQNDTALFIKTLIRQENDYRNLLTKEQLQLYLDKLDDFQKNNLEAYNSYSSLFFSEKLLKEFKIRFDYK